MLSASLIQLEYASKHWKSTFSYLAGPSGVGLGLRALRWLACADPVTDASGFPCHPSFDGGLRRCTGAVSCGRRHPPLRVRGRHARVPCVCACAHPSWPGRADRPPGRVLVRRTFSFGRFVFLLCSAPSGLGLALPVPLFASFFFSCVVPFVRLRCLLLSLVSGPGCLGPWRFVFFPPPPPSCVFFSLLVRCAPPLPLAFSGFRPRVPSALALCVVCFVGPPPLGSACALAAFVFPAWPFAAPWWLLPPRPPPPPSLFVSRGFRHCCSGPFLFFFVFFFCLLCSCLLARRSSAVLAVCPPPPSLVCFAGLPLLGSPCALAAFVFPARPLAPPWWLLPPPPPSVSRGFRRCRAVLRFFFPPLLRCSRLLAWRSSAALTVCCPPAPPPRCARGAVCCLVLPRCAALSSRVDLPHLAAASSKQASKQ